MQDEAGQREPAVPEPEGRSGMTGDPLTIALVVFFVALIAIVAALLVLPMVGGS
jgi:hypothetical protein